MSIVDLPPKKPTQIIHGEPWARGMNHSMTIRAQQRQVLKSGLRSLNKGLNGLGVMCLNKPSTSITVALLEIEATYLTTKTAKFCKRCLLALLYQLSASFPGTVKAG
jgi:hypothetical protein